MRSLKDFVLMLVLTLSLFATEREALRSFCFTLSLGEGRGEVSPFFQRAKVRIISIQKSLMG